MISLTDFMELSCFIASESLKTKHVHCLNLSTILDSFAPP